ncbi:MAG: hypothetical protein V9E81_13875 [Marmoricola sp.]
MRPSLSDLLANADRLPTLENHDPSDLDFDAPLPPLMAIKLRLPARNAEKELAQAIADARARTSAEVGAAIGTSGEAARQRSQPPDPLSPSVAGRHRSRP